MSISQDDKRVITKMMLESKYTRVNSYQQERERRHSRWRSVLGRLHALRGGASKLAV